jgi:NTE family protein
MPRKAQRDGKGSLTRSRRKKRRIALVLGGGGLKGFAHIGVLRALEELGIEPAVFAGTSIGSLIAAAYVGGMSVAEMTERARNLKRRDLFRINRIGMVRDRMRSRSIYRDGPLRDLVNGIVPDVKFGDLTKTLLVNTVDLEQGSQVVWGLPGLRNVSVAEAVYASCALPGFFPPSELEGRMCVDGGVIDNLPAGIASAGMDGVIAVDTGSTDLGAKNIVVEHGFAATYMRAATTMMHALQLVPFSTWGSPPMILLRPRINHIGWFSFAHTEELLEAGYRAAMDSLADYEGCLSSGSGIFPQRHVRISVDRGKCICCGLCVALAPSLMALDDERKAYPLHRRVEWSPADGDFLHHCPTLAIEATDVRPRGGRGKSSVDPPSDPTS